MKINEIKRKNEEQFEQEFELKSKPKKQVKIQDQAIELEEEKIDEISYVKLHEHIVNYHPRNIDKNDIKTFHVSEDMGSYSLPCFDQKVRITSLAQEIGIGPSMLLLTIKQTILFFIVLTIVNIPQYVALYGISTQKASSLQNIFTIFSLASLNVHLFACSQVNQDSQNSTFVIKCDSQIGIIQELDLIGVSSSAFDSCQSVQSMQIESFDSQFDNQCQWKNGSQSLYLFDEKSNFLEKFQSQCIGQHECTINFQDIDLSADCMQQLIGQSQTDANSQNNQNLVALAYCQQSNLQINITKSTQITITKDNFSTLILITEFVVVILFIIFIEVLNRQQQIFADQFEKQTIEMNDFCIRLTNLPDVSYYNGDENVLKIKLWCQITDIIRKQVLKNQDQNEEINFFDKKYQIFDITFGKNNVIEADLLQQMMEIKEEMIIEGVKKQKNPQNSQLFDNNIKDFYKEFQDLKHQLDKMKKKQKQKHNNTQQIIYAFVVFRSMEGCEIFKQAYEGFDFNSVSNILYSIQKQNEQKKEMKLLQIGGNWPFPEECDNPINLNWHNFGYSERDRKIRLYISWLITLITLLAAIITVNYFTSFLSSLKSPFKVSDKCPDVITKQMAYLDNQQSFSKQQGFMDCFCFAQIISSNNINNQQISFQDLNSTDKIQYCDLWYKSNLRLNSLQFGVPIIVVILNFVACLIFEFLGPFGKFYSISQETTSVFFKITLLQYCNIIVVLLFISFRVQNSFNSINILAGNYTDFNADWFKNIGGTLCLTVFLNVITPHIAKILLPLIHYLIQLYDRGFQSNLRIDGTDQVNTKQLIQPDLHDLYTNEEIPAAYIFAQFFTSFWSIMTCSAGLPILYPIGILNYVIFYWTYKILLVKYYSKTSIFDQELPLSTIIYFKTALVQHCCIAVFIFSSKLFYSQNENYQNIQNWKSSQQSKNNFGVFERFQSKIGKIDLIIQILILFIYLTKKFLYSKLRKLIKKCYADSKQKSDLQTEKEEEEEIQSEDIFQDVRLGWIDNYYEKIEEDFKNLVELEYKYIENLGEIKYQQIKLIYKIRLNDIQNQINIYMQMLVQLKEVDQNDLEEMKYSDKCSILIEKEGLILKKVQQEQLQILRLKGKVQTYEVYDYPKYQKVRIMLRMLEIEEIQELQLKQKKVQLVEKKKQLQRLLKKNSLVHQSQIYQ